jgi:hypothetical protein
VVESSSGGVGSGCAFVLPAVATKINKRKEKRADKKGEISEKMKI